MESHQDIVDLTINDDDDCLFPTELSETVNSLLKMDGMEGNKETAKQNHEDDTLSIPCAPKPNQSYDFSKFTILNANKIF